jgi:diketogulonate reductase-like aldo/keto reductase
MVICKSETPSRITDNVQIFDFQLNNDQMDRLDALESGYVVTPRTLSDYKARRRYYEEMP